MKGWFITIGLIAVFLLTVFTITGIKAVKIVEEKGLQTILVEIWEGKE